MPLKIARPLSAVMEGSSDGRFVLPLDGGPCNQQKAARHVTEARTQTLRDAMPQHAIDESFLQRCKERLVSDVDIEACQS
jgi:hypothetical protein